MTDVKWGPKVELYKRCTIRTHTSERISCRLYTISALRLDIQNKDEMTDQSPDNFALFMVPIDPTD